MVALHEVHSAGPPCYPRCPGLWAAKPGHNDAPLTLEYSAPGPVCGQTLIKHLCKGV